MFAAPLVVVVGCDRPVETHHHHRHVAQRQPDAAVDAPPPLPDELVDSLRPLYKAKTFYDACYSFPREILCNPPRVAPANAPPGWPAGTPIRTYPDKPPARSTVDVRAMVRDGAGARVRVTNPDERVDKKWRVAFVTTSDEEIPNGDCAIVDWDFEKIECVTALAPEQLVARSHETYRVEVIPP